MRGRRPVLALDTKFKTFKGRPDRADLNQMFSYCHALRVERGVLLYPHAQGIQQLRRLPAAAVEMRGVWLGGSVEQLQTHLQVVVTELVSMAERGVNPWGLTD